MRSPILLLITASLVACLSRSTRSTEPPIVTTNEESMNPAAMVSTEGLVIRAVTLQARDERILPPGTAAEGDRDIGFATVFMDIENHQESTIELTLEAIDIRNTANGEIQLATDMPQQVILRPLEYAKHAFQLTNTSGYSHHHEVKAVIHYRVNEQSGILESAPVEVDR